MLSNNTFVLTPTKRLCNICMQCCYAFRCLQRAFCLICGRVPKQPTLSAFYDVDTAALPVGNSENEFMSVSKRLRDILQITETQRNQLVPSKELCKKCFRQLVDIDFMDNQVSV